MNSENNNNSTTPPNSETKRPIPPSMTPTFSLSKPWLSRGVKLTLKLFFLLFLMLILLIPNAMISDLVRERTYRAENTKNTILASWGKNQILTGPILKLPYETQYEETVDKKTTKVWQKNYVYFLPNELNIVGKLENKILKRGIFSFPVYRSQIELSGDFKDITIETGKEPARILWQEATLQLGITDLKGIKESKVTWQGQQSTLEPQSDQGRVLSSALEMKIPLADAAEIVSPHTRNQKDARYVFNLKVDLNGGEGLQVVPLGKQTSLNLSADWPHPSFSGAFLPEDREITNSGFTAEWRIAETSRDLSRTFHYGSWREGDLFKTAFGVDLINPVDHYSLTDRSIKYAKLFILMSFVAFFLFEILAKLKIHPLQYMMVGLALVLFYLLLLSFSEHLGFAKAYTIAAAANVIVLSAYLNTILKNKKRVALMALLWSGLYAYLYTLLKLEDFSLLVGSIGLFVILSLVMFLTRKINWYQLDTGKAANNSSKANK